MTRAATNPNFPPLTGRTYFAYPTFTSTFVRSPVGVGGLCLLAWSQDLGSRTPLSTFVAFLLGTHSTDQRNGSPQLWKLNGHGGLYKRTVASFVGGLTKHEQEEVQTARELAEHMVALGLGE